MTVASDRTSVKPTVLSASQRPSTSGRPTRRCSGSATTSPTNPSHFGDKVHAGWGKGKYGGSGATTRRHAGQWEGPDMHLAILGYGRGETAPADKSRSHGSDSRERMMLERPGGRSNQTRSCQVQRGCSSAPRRPRRRLRVPGSAVGVGLMLVAAVLSGCGNSKPRAVAPSTTVSSSSLAPTSSVPVDPTTSTTGPSGVAAQAFDAYQRAFGILAEIEGDPTGRATDPRLAEAMANPWYGEVVQAIDQFRLKNEVVRGPYAFTNFRLDQVTTDGRVIFTDCERESQEVFTASTGTQLTHYGLEVTPEQVVVYHPSSGTWLVADRNSGTAGAAHACDA